MNDITYVGKHTVIYTVSRHAHESWEFVYCTYVWITGRVILLSSRP